MRQRGFSLIEIMISVGILGFIGLILGGSLARMLDAKERIETYTERQNTARIALTRMAREISMAYLTKHYNCLERRTQTLFKGKSGNKEPLLFTSLSHYKWRRDAHESDQAEITYYIDTDPDNSSNKALFRKESRRITEKAGETGKENVLAHDIESLDMHFYNADTDTWEDEWDTTRSERRFKLPMFVKLELKLPMPNGQKSRVFTTQTRIMLQDVLQFGPNPCHN